MAGVGALPVRVAGPALALAAAISSVALAQATSGRPTSYTTASAGAAMVGIVTGLALLGTGAVLVACRRGRSLGPLTVAAGVCWFAAEWVGWRDVPASGRSVAMVVAPLLVPVIVHLAVAAPTGRLGGIWRRALAVGCYAGFGVVTVGWALWRDPFREVHCWRTCSGNVFLLQPRPRTVSVLNDAWTALTLVSTVVIVGVAAWRLARSSATARRGGAVLWLVAGAACAGETAYAVALTRNPSEDPTEPTFVALFVARAALLLGVAIAVAWTAVRDERVRSAVRRLADDLGATPTPGSFRGALARTLGDSRLDVAYWLPASRQYVDAEGLPADLRPSTRTAVTPIVRGGQPVALVAHDRSLAAARGFVAEVGAAARLAVDNERLRAEVLAQLRELRASQARIVEHGDATRRRIERDLHDGAQQRLLALRYQLRLAEREATDSGDATLGGVYAKATELTDTALAELRTLALGIYPATLATSGLATALRGLAQRASIPVELDLALDHRSPPAVETAAYGVVADGVADAAARGATAVQVSAALRMGALTVTLDDDAGGRPYPDVIVRLGDRVGALGGRIEVGASRVRAVLPCA